MHWTTHVITGAAWGFAIGRPVPAAAAGVLGHLLLDIIPHRDPTSDISYVTDTVLGLSVIFLAATSKDIHRHDPGRAALWGAIGGGLPDVELVVKQMKDLENKQLLFPAHNETLPHHTTDIITSTASQALLIALSLALAARKARSREVTGCPESGAVEG